MPNAWRDAFTPEWRHPVAKLVWALRAALAGLAVFTLFVEPEHTTRPLLFFSALSGLAGSVAFAFVPTRRPRTLKAAEAAMLAAVMLHVFGHALGIYQRFAWYDTLLHAIVPFATALVLVALSQATRWVWDWTRVRPLAVAIYVFSMSVTLGVIWEAMEFGMDQLAGTREQDGLVDTMVDLLADLAGSFVGAVVAAVMTHVGRTRGIETISEEPKRPEATRAPKGRAAE